jgi:hypothetical protein
MTVHDSLTVPHELASEAAALFASTVEEATGHKPALKINRPAPELAKISASIEGGCPGSPDLLASLPSLAACCRDGHFPP